MNEDKTDFSFVAEWTNNDSLNKLWEHNQSILGKPQVGDWPPAPQVGDWPPYSYPEVPEVDPPYPSTPRKDSSVGWICPKCGSCLAPHISSCPYCSRTTTATTLNIIY